MTDHDLLYPHKCPRCGIEWRAPWKPRGAFYRVFMWLGCWWKGTEI